MIIASFLCWFVYNAFIMRINDILMALAADDGRNYKIDLLTKHKGNKVLREVVRLALDPLTQFYQRKIPEYVTEEKPWHTLESALPKLSKLSNREVTGNTAIDYLRLLLTEVSADDAYVIERIIQKDLRCGVSVSTANKVWPNLVMDYPWLVTHPSLVDSSFGFTLCVFTYFCFV